MSASSFRRPASLKRLGAALFVGLLGSVALMGALFAGCANEETLDPIGSDAGVPPDATTMPTSDAGPPKRTVESRNPFGNIAETENLLWDGDFEWHSAFSDQYGWIQNSALQIDEVVVGPRCKSGIKCARVAKSQEIIGIAVASKDSDLIASVWVRFEDDGGEATPCDKARVRLLAEGPLGNGAGISLAPVGEADAKGWCLLRALSPKQEHKVYLSIRNSGKVPMLVDDAIVKKSDGSIPPTERSTPAPPSAEERAELQATRGMISATRLPHDPPESPAKKALRAKKGTLEERGLLP